MERYEVKSGKNSIQKNAQEFNGVHAMFRQWHIDCLSRGSPHWNAPPMPEAVQKSSLELTLAEIVGSDHVITDPARRDYYSRDLSYLPYKQAVAVVIPGSVEELSSSVRTITNLGYNVIPRGGGMSYTRGYTPLNERCVIVDSQRLNRVVEVNTEDMYVVVECGCTWKQLVEELRDKGVRTPYYGPLSGMYATVGGAISQNSLFLGSGDNRTVADCVLGLEVVLANGEVVRTGSWAHKHSVPFYRHFGPDMTGLFTADTGAFGVKARAVLRLLPWPQTTLTASFGFASLQAMLAAQISLSRSGIAADCYGFDPYYNSTFEDRGFSFKQGLKTLGGVFRSANNAFSGLWDAARVAMSGRSVLRGIKYSLHIVCEGASRKIAAGKLQLARSSCLDHGGAEIDNSLPTVFNAAPFDGVGAVLLGGDGEIWLPVHGFMPLSRAQQVGAAVEEFFEQNRERMGAHDIRTSYLTCYSGSEFVIEPSFYWYDEIQEFRLDRIEPEFRKKWEGRDPEPEKRRVALQLREELRDLMDTHGCCHLQLGRYYPYREMMNCAPLWNLLSELKSVVDPDGRMNPGALGLAAGDSE